MIGFRFPRSALRAFLANEAAGGIVLIVAAALAMVVANLPATAPAYHALIHARTGPVLAPALGPMTVHLWIRSEEHTSELQSLMRISYAVFCLKKKKTKQTLQINTI